MPSPLPLPLKPGLLPGVIYCGSVRPLRITSRQASQALGAQRKSRTLQRLIHAAIIGAKKKDGTPWLVVVQWGGRGKSTMIDTASFEAAYQAMIAGEQPPPLPSDAPRRRK